MQFYIKGDDDKFVEATQEQIDKTVKGRINQAREAAINETKESLTKSLTEDLTKELTTKLTESITSEVEGQYKPKVEEAEAQVKTLTNQVNQKTVAAEYGFKPELEKYLGEGSQDDMRKEADTLKKNLAAGGGPAPEKQPGGDSTTPIQDKTGIKVEI